MQPKFVMQPKNVSRAVVAAVALGLSVGCGDDSTGPVEITEQQAVEAGGAIAEQVSGITDGFTFLGYEDVPIFKALPPILPQTHFQHLGLSTRWAQAWLAGESCATFSDTTDADLDGIPDDLIVTFGPACMMMADSVTASLSGSFRVTDPGTTAGFNIAYSDIHYRLEHLNGESIDIALNGTQGVTATETSATLGENVTLAVEAVTSSGRFRASVSQNWNAGFTAASGQTFDPNGPLPDGSISLTGSTTLVMPTGAFAFAMNTPSPLVHDAQCPSSPTLTSGELRALVSGNQGGAFVRVQFVGCGEEPIITFVGRPIQ